MPTAPIRGACRDRALVFWYPAWTARSLAGALGCNRLGLQNMINRGFRIVSLAITSAVLGCSSDASAPRGSIGPESLTVAFQPSPDTVSASGLLTVSASAHNATSRVVFARWETGRCGLTVRVFQPSGAVYATAPPVCRGSGTWTMAPGESTSMSMSVGLVAQPHGTYRVRAQVEAVGGESPAVERSIIMVP